MILGMMCYAAPRLLQCRLWEAHGRCPLRRKDNTQGAPSILSPKGPVGNMDDDDYTIAEQILSTTNQANTRPLRLALGILAFVFAEAGAVGVIVLCTATTSARALGGALAAFTGTILCLTAVHLRNKIRSKS